MKKITFIISLFALTFSYAQRPISYSFALNTTFMINENFGEYDNYTDETDWSILAPNAILFRNGLDVELNKIVSAGFKIGLDWHPDFDLLAIPYFIDTKVNLVRNDNDKFYIGGGVGKLLKLSDVFERGKYYKLGVGYEISTSDKASVLVNLDFHQKQILEFENGRLNSLSFGLGYLFL